MYTNKDISLLYSLHCICQGAVEVDQPDINLAGIAPVQGPCHAPLVQNESVRPVISVTRNNANLDEVTIPLCTTQAASAFAGVHKFRRLRLQALLALKCLLCVIAATQVWRMVVRLLTDCSRAAD